MSSGENKPSLDDLTELQIRMILYRKTPHSKAKIDQLVDKYGARGALNKAISNHTIKRWWTCLK